MKGSLGSSWYVLCCSYGKICFLVLKQEIGWYNTYGGNLSCVQWFILCNINFKVLSIFWHNNSTYMICTVDTSEICKNMCKDVRGSIKCHYKNGHNGNKCHSHKIEYYQGLFQRTENCHNLLEIENAEYKTIDMVHLKLCKNVPNCTHTVQNLYFCIEIYQHAPWLSLNLRIKSDFHPPPYFSIFSIVSMH